MANNDANHQDICAGHTHTHMQTRIHHANIAFGGKRLGEDRLIMKKHGMV